MRTGFLSQTIGRTPLVEIKSLSDKTGCRIFGKAEFLNPGGSVKDRTALGLVEQAERDGLLHPGFTIVEGTAGNTGIGIATVAAERGYRCLIVMPDNQAPEKEQTLRLLGAEVVKVPAVPFANANHFYHTARRLAEERPNSYWANQFENLANMRMHEVTTGPEIWDQTGGRIDAFVAAAGTGGTIAGVSRALKSRGTEVHVRLADPLGSGLYAYLREGELKTEGSSITEGIGIMRLTANFKEAKIDSVARIDDAAMISMLFHLGAADGLLVGPSSALNVAAAYEYALEHRGQNLTVVTVLCDSALRYQSRLLNAEYLREKNLTPRPLRGA